MAPCLSVLGDPKTILEHWVVEGKPVADCPWISDLVRIPGLPAYVVVQ